MYAHQFLSAHDCKQYDGDQKQTWNLIEETKLKRGKGGFSFLQFSDDSLALAVIATQQKDKQEFGVHPSAL